MVRASHGDRARRAERRVAPPAHRIGQPDRRADLQQLATTFLELSAKNRTHRRLLWVPLTVGLVVVVGLGLLVLRVSQSTEIWIMLAFNAPFVALGGAYASLGWARRRSGVTNAPAQFSAARTDLDRGLRAWIEDAVRQATSPNLVPPAHDVVSVGEGTHLSSRAMPEQRITTRSRAAIEQHMLRRGGATVGVTGERGTGKSELMMSFCAEAPATIKEGGTIGVVVPVPAAFEGIDFLRLLCRRLVEAVPGYETAQARTDRRRLRLAYTAWGLSIAAATLGPTVVWDRESFLEIPIVEFATSEGWGFGLLIGGVILTAVSQSVTLALLEQREVRRRRSDRRSSLKMARRLVAVDAGRLMTRLRYAETLTSSSEATLNWGKVGLTRAAGRSLNELRFLSRTWWPSSPISRTGSRRLATGSSSVSMRWTS
jgi:hypothetical protein